MAEETKKTSTRGRKPKEVVENKEEVKVEEKDNGMVDILAQMKAMQEQIEKLSKEKSVAEDLVKALQSNNKQEDESGLNADTDITVISQCVGELTLSTEGLGRGTRYSFLNFGEVQDIPFGDLRDIVKNNKSFAQNGLFYIVNDEVVSKLRLKQYYNRMISNEDMNTLFDKDANTFIELYKLATDGQKEVIINMIVDKKLKGETIDANILITLGQLSGKDLIGLSPLE